MLVEHFTIPLRKLSSLALLLLLFFKLLFHSPPETIVGSRQISQKKEKTTNESILSMLLTEMDGVGTLSPAAGDRAAEMMVRNNRPLIRY